MLTEIRKALDSASTEHEWDTDGTFIEWKDGHPLKGTHRRIAITEARVSESFKNENHENDAHLIVNTPRFLEWCLSEIFTLQQQNKQLRDLVDEMILEVRPVNETYYQNKYEAIGGNT